METETIKPVRAVIVKWLPATDHRPARWKAVPAYWGICVKAVIRPTDSNLEDGGEAATAQALLDRIKNLHGFEGWVNHRLSRKVAISHHEMLFTLEKSNA